jgi:hypothetical protein
VALPWLDTHSPVPEVVAALRRQSERNDWHAGARLFFLACVAGDTPAAGSALARVLQRPVHNPSFPKAERDAFLRIAARFGIRPATGS